MPFALATCLLTHADLFLNFLSADDKEVRINSEILSLNESKIIFVTSCRDFDFCSVIANNKSHHRASIQHIT